MNRVRAWERWRLAGQFIGSFDEILFAQLDHEPLHLAEARSGRAESPKDNSPGKQSAALGHA
jgi:hypothetical protein